MIKITWKQTENYEWTGTDEKENYVLTVHKIVFNKKKWSWWIYRDEEKIASGDWEDDTPTATTADEAKARAERALENYLAWNIWRTEQESYINILREVLQPPEIDPATELENAIEREMYLRQQP